MFKKLTTTILTISLAALVLPTKVLAQECPYDICVPDTDITIGNITITTETLVFLACVAAVGMVMLLVAYLLRQESKEIAA